MISQRTRILPSRMPFSVWGLASLVLLIAGNAAGEYNLYVQDHTSRPWITWDVMNKSGVLVHLAGLVCGVIAMWRDNKWWGLTLPFAFISALGYYLGDL